LGCKISLQIYFLLLAFKLFPKNFGTVSEEFVKGVEAIRGREESQHVEWLLLDDSEAKYASSQ
jgi:hypothetical protein